ncbi:MAG: ABC transporter ATP-binding protein [Acidaminococcaceae bacterium]|nr:ABC transporter ATP-binding protein [Acidaminococcaceae bacterium]
MLTLVNVYTAYGSVPVLKNVTLEVPDGQITCLLGSNGAGKSTTINTILGFVKPKAGQVLFRGKDISGKSTESIVRSGVGVVPEGRRVFPKLTVEENLFVGACACSDKTRIKENIAKAYTMFPRLAERRTQNAGTMSGGEQQMLAISRALMGEPEILLLDEPSLGLAPLVVNDIFNTIKQLNKDGMTILLIEQNGAKALEMADRGYLMQKGELIASCTEKTAEAKEKLMTVYLNQQKGKEA